MADELRHFVQTIYEASDAPAWAHDRAAQLLDMPSLAHGCAKDRAEIDTIKERLRYKCEEQQSPDCMVLDDQRLEYRVTIAEFLEFIRDHDRQAEQLAELKRGLRNNNSDFELAFLDAYLDKFRSLNAALAAADELVECISAIPDCRFGGREDRRRNLLVSKKHANRAQRLAAAYSATRTEKPEPAEGRGDGDAKDD